MRHGPIVLRCPENGPETPSLGEAKRRNKDGDLYESNSGEALHTGPSSDAYRNFAQPTSARDGPHVGTHVCTPLKLEELFPNSWSPLFGQLLADMGMIRIRI